MQAKSLTYKQKARIARRVLEGEPVGDLAKETNQSAADIELWTDSFTSGGVERIRQDFPPKSQQPSFPRPDPTIKTIQQALDYAQPKYGQKTYGGYLSNALAIVLANALREHGFDGVLPDEHGGFESPVRGARGLKKLDVNYSTPEMGLGLGLSIKTISSRDPGTKRYTKNYSRNDNELRAEAVDYHRRQPFAVLAAFLFLPGDACDDAGAAGSNSDEDEAGVSSFGAAVKYFRHRTPRVDHEDEPDLFEAFYVVVYEPTGDAKFWPVHDLNLPPPAARRPYESEAADLDTAVRQVISVYESRNNPHFEWAES